jgi:hypothetical protein
MFGTKHRSVEKVESDVLSANGSQVEVYSTCKTSIDIVLNGTTMSHKMIIADLSVDGILGLDFLVKHEAVIDTGRQQMSICGRDHPIILEGCATPYGVAIAHGVSVSPRTQPMADHICTSGDGGRPMKIRKTSCSSEKHKVKVKNLPLKYEPVSTTNGNSGRAARVKEKMETSTHASMTASRRLPCHMPKVPSHESVWIKRERMKRRKGKKQVVYCDKVKICKDHVLNDEGTELGLGCTEQGSSCSPNTDMDLENQIEDLGSSSKNIDVTDELVVDNRRRRERRTPTWLEEYVRD